MGFNWIEINVGDIIRKAHIDELRDNIDSIKDNEACITYKSGVLHNHHSDEKSSEYTTYQNTNYPGNASKDYIHEYSGQNGTANNQAKGGVQASEKGTVKTNEIGTYQNAHDEGYQW